jgi:DNA polymerase-1
LQDTPAALADAVAAPATEAAATAAGLLFRDLSIDFPLNVVRSCARTPTRGSQL